MTKIICAFIIFKAESKSKHEENLFGGFSLKIKKKLCGGPKWKFLKVKFHIFFAFVL